MKYIFTLLFVSTYAWLFGQEFYVNQANGNISLVNIQTCTHRVLTNINPNRLTDRGYGDMTFTRDGQLYGVTLGGRVHRINLAIPDTQFVAQLPPSRIESFNSMVSDANGLIYIASSQGSLFTLQPNTGQIQRLGIIPFAAAGDLIFYKNTLYMAAQNNRLVEVNTSNPGASRVYMNFNINTSIFGIVAVSPNCKDVRAYAIADNSDVYTIDFEGRRLSFVCNIATNDAIFGAASLLEFNAAAVININQIQIQNADCGRRDGSIALNATGGAGALSYSLDGQNFQSNPLFSNLPNGTYRLQVRDTEGCDADTTVILRGAGEPVIGTPRVVPNACGSTQNGSIDIEARSTDSSSLSYSIDSVSFTPQGRFTGLRSGDYRIWVRSSRGCVVSQNVSITDLPLPAIIDVQPVATRCGQPNGRLSFSSNTTAEAAHRYSLDGQCYQVSAVFEGLQAGRYTMFVRDTSGCVRSREARIDSSRTIKIRGTEVVSTTCGLPNGRITVAAAWSDGHLTPLSYQLNNGVGQLSGLFENLSPQRYLIRISGADCQDSVAIQVAPSDSIRVQDVGIRQPDCALANGSIDIKAVGNGPLSYQINLSSIQQTGQFQNLEKGRYLITLRDTQQCQRILPPIVLGPTCFIFIPNAFSPNGDGQNDRFTVFGDLNYVKKINVLRLYNRWGNMIFEDYDLSLNDENSGWNGLYMNKLLDPAVFIYYVEIMLWDNTTTILKGDVTLMR